MKKLLLLTTLIACLAGGIYASNLITNSYGREHTILNGKWNYIIDPLENGFYNYRLEESPNGFFKNQKPKDKSELVEYDFDASAVMNIPSDWNSRNSQLFIYEGTVWFKRDFDLKLNPERTYQLYFGAVNYEAIVYVNGKKVGSHIGGYNPFNFDVTNYLKEGENFVVVKVDNKRHKSAVPTVNMDWWNYGGITRDVLLLSLPKKHVESYKIGLENKKSDKIEAMFKLNTSVKGEKVVLSIPELNVRTTALTDLDGVASVSSNVKPTLWSCELPKLYDVSIECNGEVINDKVGFRTIETKGKTILLNGKPVFLRGVSLHEEAPFGRGRANSSQHAEVLMTWAKQMGCNYLRLAHYPHNENMVRKAEEMGIMVWSEIPVYWTIDWENPDTYANAERQLTDMITRDINRANVVIWSIANETPHSDARDKFLSKLAVKARSMDNSRLISMAMEVTVAENGINRLSDSMNEYVDIVSFNQYCGWYRETNDACRTMVWEIPYNKPVIISEFGGGALQGLHGDKTERWTEEYQEELYIRNLEMLDKIDGLAGLSPWILVDFRSARRQLPVIQDFYNRKGLISSEGVPKKAFYVMQNYYKNKSTKPQP